MTSTPRALPTLSCLTAAAMLAAPSLRAGEVPPASRVAPAPVAPPAPAAPTGALPPSAGDVLRVIGDTAGQKTEREAVEDIGQAYKDLQSSAAAVTPSASTVAIKRLQTRAVRLARQASRLESRDPIGASAAAALPEIQSWLALRRQAELLRTTIQGEAAQVERADPTRDPALVQGLIASLEQHVSALRDLARAADGELDHIRATYLSSAGLVVSGGISLGSYQAGFLYYYTRFLWALGQRLRTLFPVDGGASPAQVGGFKLVTGASAGSINAFLSAVAGCRRPTLEPEKSLFYRAWIPVGTDTLIDPEQVKVDGVLSRRPIEDAAAAIGKLWTEAGERGGWEACDAYLGISATRLHGRTLSFPEKVSAEVEPGAPATAMTRLTEKFILRMAGRPGAPPAFSSFRPHPRDPKAEPPAEVYPTLGAAGPGPVERTQIDDLPARIEDVLTLLQASSSFPFAFPPVELPLTIWRRRDGAPATPGTPVATTTAAAPPRLPPPLFSGVPEPRVKLVDGGVFDNTPLGLAIRLGEWMPQAPARFLFLVSSNVAWRRPASPPAATPAAGAAQGPGPSYPGTTFAAYVPFLSDFVSASEDTELMNTVEGHGDINRELPARQMPVAGEQLGHFLAFVERDFRIFDFYTGMVDAHAHVGTHNKEQLALLPDGGELAVPSPPYACFLAQRRHLDTLALEAIPTLPECRNLDGNLLALLQASTKIRRAANAASAPSPSDPLQDFFDALDEFGYRFRELSYRGRPATGATAKRAIRDQMQALAHDLAAKQDGEGNKLVVSVAAKAVPNLFLYRPPSFYLGVGLDTDAGGEIEQGIELGRLPFASRPALRLTLSERVREWDRSKLDAAAGKFSYAATFMGAAHLMLELPISNVFQLELGGGAAILERVAWPHDPLLWRFGPEGTLRLDFLQRFYLGAGFVYYLDDCAGHNGCSHVPARFRDLPGAITSSVYKAWVAVGIRFFWFN